MVRVTVLRRFTDLVERCIRLEGDVFDVTQARASQLEKRLPAGYVLVERAAKEALAEDAVAPEQDAPAHDAERLKPDYASMTKAELVTSCEERGIEVPKRATKAKLVELLTKE